MGLAVGGEVEHPARIDAREALAILAEGRFRRFVRHQLVIAHQADEPVASREGRHAVRIAGHEQAVAHGIPGLRQHLVGEAARQVEQSARIAAQRSVALHLVQVRARVRPPAPGEEGQDGERARGRCGAREEGPARQAHAYLRIGRSSLSRGSFPERVPPFAEKTGNMIPCKQGPVFNEFLRTPIDHVHALAYKPRRQAPGKGSGAVDAFTKGLSDEDFLRKARRSRAQVGCDRR